jgi:predicted DCC family thiol-disulfide oxidoreductase YuxK
VGQPLTLGLVKLFLGNKVLHALPSQSRKDDKCFDAWPQGLSHDAVIILFDGVCNLCEASVQFVYRRDPGGAFRFAPIQSGIGSALLGPQGQSGDLSTFYVLTYDRLFVKSDAWLQIVRRLRGPWRLLIVLQIIPRRLRDLVYDFVGTRRYRWFGKKEACVVPTGDFSRRFL